jgi:hypothetical protein
MMAVTVIDRLINHTVVLEMPSKNFRQQQAKEKLLPPLKTATAQGVSSSFIVNGSTLAADSQTALAKAFFKYLSLRKYLLFDN